MTHIQYTICRSGTYYYNRRVPKHAVSAYGSFIRQSLSQCPEEAAEYAFRLNTVLESSWKFRVGVTAVDVPTIIESFKPRASLLSEMPGLSVAHIRANFETGAGPLKRMVEAFAEEPEKLSSLRNEIDKCIAGYFEDNLLRMDFLMAKGKKPYVVSDDQTNPN